MYFESEEELFHDIPEPGAVEEHYDQLSNSFASYYYGSALDDAAAIAEKNLGGRFLAGDELEEACRPFFSSSLREVLDKYLEAKRPIVAFPRAGKVGAAYVSKGYDIFGGDYAEKLARDLKNGMNGLWRKRENHRGNFMFEKRKIRNSVLILLILILFLIFDLPWRLAMQPLQSFYQLLMPMFPWGEGSVAHEILPNLAAMVIWGVIAGILVYRAQKGMKDRIRIRYDTNTNHIKTLVQLTALGQVFWPLMRVGMGMEFLGAVDEWKGIWAARADSSTSMLVLEFLEEIVLKGQALTVVLLLIYIIAFFQQIICYLSMCRTQRQALEDEERLTQDDIKAQWNHYTRFHQDDLRKADRQLKFLDIWYHVINPKSKREHFPGWFDINIYVEEMEQALFPENRPLFRELNEEFKKRKEAEKYQKEKLQKEQEDRKREAEVIAAADNRTDEKKEADKRAAIARIPQCWGADGKLADVNEAFKILKNVLGYWSITPAEPYPSDAPGAALFEAGYKSECLGRYYRGIIKNYEDAAKEGHLLALARLANVYDTDYRLTDSTGHDHPMTQEQWPHPMEQDAAGARLTMGLTKDASTEILLSHAWHPASGFDKEVLYYLAMHCNEKTAVAKAARHFAYQFVIDILSRDPDERDSWFLAQINYYCCKNMAATRLWAEASAGGEYPPALYFLYEHQKELGIDYKLAQAYCYRAWEDSSGYPPARISEIWDKLNENARREMERNVERLRKDALRQAKEKQMKEQMAAFKRSLEKRERLENAILLGAALDDDEALAAGKISMEEYIGDSMSKEDKISRYQKKLESGDET